MNSSIGDAFCTHASKLINLNVNKKYRMHEVNGCTSDRVSRSEQKAIPEKEGIARAKKIYLTNLAVDNLSSLYLHKQKELKYIGKPRKHWEHTPQLI